MYARERDDSSTNKNGMDVDAGLRMECAMQVKSAVCTHVTWSKRIAHVVVDARRQGAQNPPAHARADPSLPSIVYQMNGKRILRPGTFPNSLLSSLCFLMLHCAICAVDTSRNSHEVSVWTMTEKTSHANTSNV